MFNCTHCLVSQCVWSRTSAAQESNGHDCHTDTWSGYYANIYPPSDHYLSLTVCSRWYKPLLCYTQANCDKYIKQVIQSHPDTHTSSCLSDKGFILLCYVSVVYTHICNCYYCAYNSIIPWRHLWLKHVVYAIKCTFTLE